MRPLFSIITPTLNRAAFIEAAVRSVRAQGRVDVEHIVVDGASSDATLATLALYPGLRVLSEPDEGMYHALNKGLVLARGELIGFLNSDDCYAAGAFNAVAQAFESAPLLAVGGEALIEELHGESRVLATRWHPGRTSLLEQATLGAPAFNAWFFRRECFVRLGRFDASLRIAGDRDFMLRLALAGLPHQVLDRPVYRYLRHAGSLTFGPGSSGFERVVREHLRMSTRELARAGLPREARQLLRRWRTRETLDLAARALRKRELRVLLDSAAAGTRSDPWWPFRLAQRACGAGMRRSGGGTPSELAP